MKNVIFEILAVYHDMFDSSHLVKFCILHAIDLLAKLSLFIASTYKPVNSLLKLNFDKFTCLCLQDLQLIVVFVPEFDLLAYILGELE